MGMAAPARDTDNAMLPRQITHQNIFRVLMAGFTLVIVLLAAAAIVGIRNIQSIQENANSLVREQSLTNRLIDELHSQQTTLSEVFSVLERDPDSVDYYKIMSQLDEADRDIARISGEGARTAEHDLWQRLNRSSLDFSREARRLLDIEDPETFSSIDLFRFHGAFTTVVARLLEGEYRKLNAAQAQIERPTSHLRDNSLVFAGSSVLLALIFAVVTVRMVSQLIRRLEWQTAELGQSLTAVRTNLSALTAAGGESAAHWGPRLADCLHLVDEAIGNVRQMSQLLRPTILDDFGLEAGLRWLAEGFAARTGIEVAVDSSYSGRLPDEAETHLFRISQEALTNIARHAGAHHVQMKLTSSGAEIRLTIQDDGRGLSAAPTTGRGLGLIGMRARARSAGGDTPVRSRPGQGVLIEVRVPLHDETHAHPVG